MGVLLDGYPWWSQLTDIDPRTHRPDVFATTDCGEETASIWIAGRTRKYTDAADLRRQLDGPRVDGRTSPADVARLCSLHGVPAVPVQSPLTTLKPTLRHELDQHIPAALLGSWIDIKELHWILMVGYGNDALIAMEPFSGRLTAYRWNTVYSLATGDYVRERIGSDS